MEPPFTISIRYISHTFYTHVRCVTLDIWHLMFLSIRNRGRNFHLFRLWVESLVLACAAVYIVALAFESSTLPDRVNDYISVLRRTYVRTYRRLSYVGLASGKCHICQTENYVP